MIDLYGFTEVVIHGVVTFSTRNHTLPLGRAAGTSFADCWGGRLGAYHLPIEEPSGSRGRTLISFADYCGLLLIYLLLYGPQRTITDLLLTTAILL